MEDGDISIELQGLTQVEETFIARACPAMCVCWLSWDQGGYGILVAMNNFEVIGSLGSLQRLPTLAADAPHQKRTHKTYFFHNVDATYSQQISPTGVVGESYRNMFLVWVTKGLALVLHVAPLGCPLVNPWMVATRLPPKDAINSRTPTKKCKRQKLEHMLLWNTTEIHTDWLIVELVRVPW